MNKTIVLKKTFALLLRVVVGNSEIQPILTGARQRTEEDVRGLMQETLDSYGAGIQIREVKMQKVDPPSAVIDSFRDVQAARADQERARNEANAYANKVVPEAQGESEKIRRESEAYQSQTVAEAEGQAKRFVSIYSEYIEAKDVTRQRLFLETMEKVFNDMNKIIIDSDAVGGLWCHGGGSFRGDASRFVRALTCVIVPCLFW